MKKHLALMLCAAALTGTTAMAQRTCGADEYRHQEELANPGLKQTRAKLNEQINALVAQGAANRGPNNVITIPIVVHVVYQNAAENISDALILGQINRLNQDYRKQNADASQVPSVFAPLAADVEIEFCLAQRDPNNNPTSGITRTQTSVSSFSTNNLIKSDATGGKTGWDPTKYMNFWIGDLGGNLLGYAQFPGGSPATDGVVVHYGSVPGGFMAPYNQGRTATHEVGHWLNLSHIWGGGTCGNDNVADTPTQSGPNYGCPSFPSPSCGNSGDMSMNYMDYTDDACMFMFTAGQKARMIAAMNASRPGLITSNGCVPVSLQAIDASVTGITMTPVGGPCSGSLSPVVTIKNMGSNPLTSVTINYQIDGGATSTFAWTGNLASLATANVTLPNVTATNGAHTITASTSSPNGGTDGNPSNNSASQSFTATSAGPGIVMAAPQGFEGGTYPPAGFQVQNPDGGISWERTTSAAALGTASIFVNNYDYQAPGEMDDFVMPSINLSSIPNAKLTFSVAYKFYSGSAGVFEDALEVLISTNCGQTFNTIYSKAGANLATGSAPFGISGEFTPAGPSDWRMETIDLAPYLSSNSAIIKFRNITQYGNNLFLDNIMISSLVGLAENNALNNQVQLFPNPSTGMVNVTLAEEAAKGNVEIQITDVVGKVVATQQRSDNSQNTFTFDLNQLPNGVYMARISTNNASTVQRFVIAH